MAEHLYTYINPTSERDLDRVCRLLERDGVIAYPVDVNWAFGCDASSVKALDRIRRLKPTHPRDRPFSLICSDISMASTVGNIDNNQYRVLKKCWPGPYTVILKRQRTLARQIKDKRQVVGVRIPESPLLRDLVTRLGKPLATTSVPELADGEIPKFGYQIIEEFGHGIDLLMDLGEEMPGLESTVIDFTEDEPVVVRAGVGDPEQFGG
ncbi:MAG: L-threonylcarbamoyladenylate synthase [Pseudobdellovibrionaceae bacterium]|nr:L-threonylcarbamoyladenylate synthase [Pseudobdellovibrionaceae bacterium]